MALSPKDQERIIEEEKLRFKVRQDLHAQSCAQHPRRGRWLWVLALVALGLVLWHHACRYDRGCPWAGRGGMMAPGCMHGGMMMPPMDGQDQPLPPAPDASDKAPARKPQAEAKP